MSEWRMTASDTGRALVTAMCIGQVGNLLPHVAVPAVMAQHLIPLWHLTASEAGLMASSFAIGYMLAVPVLTTLTDRIDARIILLVGSAVSGLATFAFGLFADGLLSAMADLGPGRHRLRRRLHAGPQGADGSAATGRHVAKRDALHGHLLVRRRPVVPDRAARGRQLRMARRLLPDRARSARHDRGLPRAWPRSPAPSTDRCSISSPVFRNRPALGYMFGYGAHCFELYALRTWIVAFWTYVVARNGGSALLEPIAVSVIAAVLAMPASILGNEAAIRFGRHRAIVAFMCLAALVAIADRLRRRRRARRCCWPCCSSTRLPIPADSGALTSGMTASADPPTAAPRWRCIRRWASGFRPQAAGSSAWRSMPAAAWTRRRDGCWRFSSWPPADCSDRWRSGGRGLPPPSDTCRSSTLTGDAVRRQRSRLAAVTLR